MDAIARLIYRPKRASYEVKDLGPQRFELADKREYERVDFVVRNRRGHALQCSRFQLADQKDEVPVVVYCHGNCGSRFEAFEAAERLLLVDIAVVAFDFSGCGRSDGDTVSLGSYEQGDIGAVVEYVRNLGLFSLVGLWGRSMGAVASLLFASTDSSIASVVLDSPFVDLEVLIRETVAAYRIPLPGRALNVILSSLQRHIEKRAGFRFGDVNVRGAAKSCFAPAMMVHGTQDSVIQASHTLEINELYAGDNFLQLFPGDHNDTRPDWLQHAMVIFFVNTLCSSKSPQAAPSDGDGDKGVGSSSSNSAAATHNKKPPRPRRLPPLDVQAQVTHDPIQPIPRSPVAPVYTEVEELGDGATAGEVPVSDEEMSVFSRATRPLSALGSPKKMGGGGGIS